VASFETDLCLEFAGCFEQEPSHLLGNNNLKTHFSIGRQSSESEMAVAEPEGVGVGVERSVGYFADIDADFDNSVRC